MYDRVTSQQGPRIRLLQFMIGLGNVPEQNREPAPRCGKNSLRAPAARGLVRFETRNPIGDMLSLGGFPA